MKSEDFQIDDEPVAGEDVHFTIPQGMGNSSATIFIDGHIVGRRECPDPPCYEAVHLPQSSANSYMRIEVEGQGVSLGYESQIVPSYDIDAAGDSANDRGEYSSDEDLM
jgi:hypothetical protein